MPSGRVGHQPTLPPRGRRWVAALALGLATLAMSLGWAARAGRGVPAALSWFDWDSYSSHAMRMKDKVVFVHGVAQPGPAVVMTRRLHSPDAESRDYPYPTNDGTPQWPSSAPIHDTRSGNDHPVWDGTQLYRNWGVPRDGVVVSKDCKFLPRKDCLPETMKNWRHGQLLPHKDKQFMIEADSEWKGPEGAKRTPPGNERLTLSGEQEAKDIFEGEDKADLKRQLGALKTQVGYLAKKLSSPVAYAAPAAYAPVAGGPAPGVVSYPGPVVYAGGQLQGWNYGPTPLSAPGLGPAAQQSMVTHTIPDSIMKAFEHDDKDWKPVMKKIKCTTCEVAVHTAAPVLGAIPLAQRSVASARVATRPVAASGSAMGIPGDAITGGTAGYAAYWDGFGAPVSNGGFAGVEAPLPVGPGEVMVPGAGAAGTLGFSPGAAGTFGFMGASGSRASVLPPVAFSAAAAAGGIPTTVHRDTWAPGSPHARRNPAPKGSKLHGVKGAGVVRDAIAESQPFADTGPYRPALHALPAQGDLAFKVIDPHLAAQSGARLAAEAGFKRGNWKGSLNTQRSVKSEALMRMEARAAQQGGMVVDLPSAAAPTSAVDVPPLTYAGIPVDYGAEGQLAAAPLPYAMGAQMAAEAPQQLLLATHMPSLAPAQQLSQRPQESPGKGNMLGRAFIDTLASLVEHRIEAEKDGTGQEKRQEKGKAAERPLMRSKGLRGKGLRATARSQLSAGDTRRASLQREHLIAESEMLEQVAAAVVVVVCVCVSVFPCLCVSVYYATECVPRMAGACAVFCCVEHHAKQTADAPVFCGLPTSRIGDISL
jgi:hypothetical protein